MPTLIDRFQQVNNQLLNTRQHLQIQRTTSEFYRRLESCNGLNLWKVCQKIHQLEEQVTENLHGWIQHKTPSRNALNFQTVRNKHQLIKKAKIFKLATRIMSIASIILGSLALTFSILSFFFPLTMISTVSLIINPTFLISYISTVVVQEIAGNPIKLRKRTNTSDNFQSFVHRYLVEKLHFTPKPTDLMDPKLHTIYTHWKAKGENIFKKNKKAL